MLEGFFDPRTVAVVGVARDEGKVGHFVFDNIRASFSGTVWPVNPHAAEIHGHRCYPTLEALPGVPDLVVVAVPAEAVPDVMRECVTRGVGAVVVLSAGFKEVGPRGAALERELAAVAREGGVRLLGPNTLGLVSLPACLNAAFAGALPRRGGVAFLSQSGALGTAVLDESSREGAGLAAFVSLGNRADVTEADLLDRWREDPQVSAAAGYLESVADGPAFIASASEFARVKPLVLLKGGTSDAGAKAVSSHTGSLAGSSAAFHAAALRTGAVLAADSEALLDAMLAFDLGRPFAEGGVAIVTNAGGLGVLASDEAARSGVEIAVLSLTTVNALRAGLPAAAAVYDPVDLLGDADADRYRLALSAILADEGVGAVLVLLTPQAMTPAEEIARVLTRFASETDRAVVACFAGGRAVDAAHTLLRDAGIPCYPTPERAVRALALLDARRRVATVAAADRVRPDTVDRALASSIVTRLGAEGPRMADFEDAGMLLDAYSIPRVTSGLAADAAEASDIAERVGFPVALKISSPDITHKSDVGGVLLDLADAHAVQSGFGELLTRVRRRAPAAHLRGAVVQHQIAPGREVIVGVERDPVFGPLLMVGLGGVHVEVLRDVTFSLCPVTPAEARGMLRSLRGFALLMGVRGTPPADIDALTELISRVSWLAHDEPLIAELDLNPVIVAERGGGACVADLRIGIGG